MPDDESLLGASGEPSDAEKVRAMVRLSHAIIAGDRLPATAVNTVILALAKTVVHLAGE